MYETTRNYQVEFTAHGHSNLECDHVLQASLQVLCSLNSLERFHSRHPQFWQLTFDLRTTHHVALGVGHQLERLRKFARLSGLELVVIT